MSIAEQCQALQFAADSLRDARFRTFVGCVLRACRAAEQAVRHRLELLQGHFARNTLSELTKGT